MKEISLEREATTPARADAIAHWHATLDDAPTRIELPTDRPRAKSTRAEPATVPLCLDANLGQDVLLSASRHELAPFALLHAALVLLLSRWCYQDDVIIGARLGRSERTRLVPGLDPDPLVLRTRLTGTSTVSEFLASIHQSDIAAARHPVQSFTQLAGELRPEEMLPELPSLQVLLTLGDREAAVRSSELARPADLAAGAGSFELVFRFVEASAGGLQGSLVYDAALFDATTAAHLKELLRALVRAEPDSPVSDPPMLPPEELHLVTALWNATEARYPDTATLADLFEAQVARAPRFAPSRLHDPGGLHVAREDAAHPERQAQSPGATRTRGEPRRRWRLPCAAHAAGSNACRHLERGSRSRTRRDRRQLLRYRRRLDYRLPDHRAREEGGHRADATRACDASDDRRAL